MISSYPHQIGLEGYANAAVHQHGFTQVTGWRHGGTRNSQVESGGEGMKVLDCKTTEGVKQSQLLPERNYDTWTRDSVSQKQPNWIEPIFHLASFRNSKEFRFYDV